MPGKEKHKQSPRPPPFSHGDLLRPAFDLFSISPSMLAFFGNAMIIGVAVKPARMQLARIFLVARPFFARSFFVP
jgi:hypothetical protein